MRLLFITVKMMRILRFLQARPYWLYKGSAGLVVIANGLILVNLATTQDEVIFYPLVVSLRPASYYMFWAALFVLLGETAVYITRKPRNSFWGHLGFGALIIACTLLSTAIIGQHIGDANPRAHVTRIGYNDHMYNLAEDGWGLVNFNTTIPAALYECDRYGVMCHVVGRFDLATEIWIPPPYRRTVIELVADSDANAISVLVDGRVVYTYAL